MDGDIEKPEGNLHSKYRSYTTDDIEDHFLLSEELLSEIGAAGDNGTENMDETYCRCIRLHRRSVLGEVLDGGEVVFCIEDLDPIEEQVITKEMVVRQLLPSPDDGSVDQ